MNRLLSISLILSGLSTIPASAQLDTNNNGLSDVWERQFNDGQLFSSAVLAANDDDGDGRTNLEESTAGTDPNSGQPPLGFLIKEIRHVPATWFNDPEEEEPILLTPEAYEIDWLSVLGKRYVLLVSQDLTAESWTAVGEPVIGDGEIISFGMLPTLIGGQPAERLFWRVAVSDIDSDDDGLFDYEEHVLGLNPNNPETIKDIRDLWLATHFPDWPNTFDPDDDPDNDGLTNSEENEFDLDPNSADSIGPINLGFDEEITDYETISFREENPSDLYEQDSVPGWLAATGEHIEIWDEGDGNPYVELQSHLGAHGVKQEFDMLPGTRLTFVLRYKGRYYWDAYDNAFDLVVEGASELHVNGTAVEESGDERSHAFMEDDEPDKYLEWHYASVSITAPPGISGLMPITLSLVPQTTTTYDESDITYGGFVDFLPNALVIDADNTGGFKRPSATTERLELREWPSEEPLDPAFPGKILFVNSGDEDSDDVLDFADGLDVFENDGFRYPANAPERSESARLVPIVLTLTTPFADLGTLPVRFHYDASDPNDITKTGPTDAPHYEPATGSLRLWKRSESGHQFGDEESPSPIRSVLPVSEEGDYIPPDTVIDAADLGFSETRDTVVLYIESVRASEELRDHTISVEVDYSSDTESADFLTIGRVECTSMDIGLVRVNDDNTTTAVTSIEASSPIPEIQISSIGIDDVEATNDHSGIIGTLAITGSVRSMLCDFTPPSGPGVINEVSVYINGDDEAAAVITTTVSKSNDTGSFLSPYPFEGQFSDNLAELPLIEGSNTIRIEAVDPIDGSIGSVEYIVDIEAISPQADVNGGAGTDVIATLDLEFASELNIEAPDTLTASLTTTLGTVSDVALIETGDDTRIFEDVAETFTLDLNVGGTQFNAIKPDLASANLTHTTLAEDGLIFALLRETGDDTLIFRQYLIDDSDAWMSEDYEDFVFNHGPVNLGKTNGPGTLNPFMLRLLGPESLLAFIDVIETDDGPRKVIKSEIDDQYYLKMKNSQAAIYLWKLWRSTDNRQATNEERMLALLDMVADGLDVAIQFEIGVAHGMYDGGADMLEGFKNLLILSLKATYKWTPNALVVRMVNGDSFEAEKKFGAVTGKSLKAVANFYVLLKGEETAFKEALITSLIAGDDTAINSQLESMGDQYGEAFIAAAEVLEALSEHIAQLTPREQGYIMGRASYEILSIFLSWAKVGQVTKLTKANFLKTLNEIPFFKTGKGKPAFDKLLTQVDYLNRLATTKMCFPPGTPVAAAQGPVAIELIRPDDLVWSRCPDTGQIALKPVVQVFVTHPARLYHLVTRSGRSSEEDGEEAEHPLVTTGEHPFWIVEKQAFVPASELKPGDTFLTLEGNHETLASTRLEHAPRGETFTTYNFEVAEFHTYFVGEAAIWVHNRGKGITCEDLFSLIDRRARVLGKSHEGALESVRFGALKSVKDRFYGSPNFDSPWWAKFTVENTKTMLTDYRTGKFTDISQFPTVKQWNRDYFRSGSSTQLLKRPGNVDVHHSVEKYIQEKLGIPVQFRDECPGIPMANRNVNGDPPPYHSVKAEDGGLAATFRTNGNIPQNMASATLAEKQLIVDKLRDVYENGGLGTNDFWPVTRDWLRKLQQQGDLDTGLIISD